MKFQKLTLVQWIGLVIVLGLGYGYVMFQHSFVPAGPIRTVLFAIVTLALYAGYFYFVKPEKKFALANLLAVIMGAAAALIILIQDIIIKHMMTPKFLIILGGAIGLPYLAAVLYREKSKDN